MTNQFHTAVKSVSQNNNFERKITKKAVYLKIDESVLEWFRQGGSGYQVRINQVLREFVHQMKLQDSNRVVENVPANHLVIQTAQALFEKYYTICFWHMRRDLIVTERTLPAIIQGLRLNGGREGYMEAARLCQ